MTRPAIASLGGSKIREVANAAMGRADVLPFWFGESDQPTPAFIREAAAVALAAGETFYTSNFGQPYVREAISDYLSTLHGREIGVDRLAATSSGVSALMLAMQLVLSPGDRVVAVTPLWPNLVEIPHILSAHVTRVSLIVENGRWQLDTDRLLAALTADTRLLLLNSPNNPTGWTITEPELRRVFEHCDRLGIWIIADDVYERLAFRAGEKSAPSLLRLADAEARVISVNSFSKAWRMTGWRAGWLVVPPALLEDLGKIIEFNTSCLPEFVQRAGTVALREGEESVVALRAEMSHASAHLRAALTSLPGVDLPLAEGAMYAFFRLEGQTDSLALAKDLIAKVGLGLAPGVAFGPEGEGWLRWCFANHPAKLDEGIARLRKYLRT